MWVLKKSVSKEQWCKHFAISLLAAVSAFAALSSNAGSPKELVAEIARHAAQQQVEVGVAAIHLQTGETITVNGDKSYPMASTYKVPIAAYAFHLVEQGELSLDQLIALKSSERMKWSPVYDTFSYPGVSLSLLNWIEPMLIHSDNTATDVVLNNIGGGKRVTQWLKDSGIDALRIDRTTADLVRDYYKMPQPDNPEIGFGEQYEAFIDGQPVPSKEVQNQYYADLNADPRDQSTPRAMAKLLQKIWSGKVINAQHRTLMQEIMARCATGSNRLSGKLPAHALPIAHKTGTIGGTLNDVGVINLPDGKGEVAVAVYTRGQVFMSDADSARAAAAISDIGRSVYDYFLLASKDK